MVGDDGTIEESLFSQRSINRQIKKVEKEVVSWWEKAKSFAKEQLNIDLGGKKDVAPVTGETGVQYTASEKKQIEEIKQNRNEVKELTSNLPDYKTETAKNTAVEIKKAADKISAQNITSIEVPGVSGDSTLKRDKQGVPVFNLVEEKKIKSNKGNIKIVKVKVDKIPALNIGIEPKISKSDFQLSEIKVFQPDYRVATALPAPRLISQSRIDNWRTMKVAVVAEAKSINRKEIGLDQIVSFKTIEEAMPKIVGEKVFEGLPYKPFKEQHLKFLSALILYEQGDNCHVVSGLFDELSQVKDHSKQANYLLGICSHELGFYSESVYRLIQVIEEEDPIATPKAIKVLVGHLPPEYEPRVAKTLLNLKNKALIPEEAKNNAYYILAKGQSSDRQFKVAESYAEKVSASSEKYPRAQFILSVSKYANNEVENSIKTLKELRVYIQEHKIEDVELRSLISVNLGRMLFQNGNYQESLTEYLKVKKNSPFWVQALIEQAWSQVMVNDPAGAIGNMYSLHSPYFTAVYKPESYVVRTIGYLNICQYGDAYQTLNLMEEIYRPWKEQIAGYIKRTGKTEGYYTTLKKYLTGKSTVNVDNLPYQVIREVARHRNFLNIQDSINQKEDDIEQYSFINKLIISDKAKIRKFKQREDVQIASLTKILKAADLGKKIKIDKYATQQKLASHVRSMEKYRFKLQVFEQGRQAFKTMKAASLKRLANEKLVLKGKAAYALKENLKMIDSKLAKLLDNNELLRYEVLAGSGENIRYQVASSGGDSGDSKNRLPASYQPKKTLSWSVTGEYWEDEIGNYRSQLRNNCPEAKGMPLPLPAKVQAGK